jgi:DNA-directed RNA polymerase subunit RPC12/RpoP
MLGCEQCNREVPALALWTALQRSARLVCSQCGRQVTKDHLVKQSETDQETRALLLALGLLNTFGWVSYDALTNAGVDANPQMIGGLLTGLVRSGLLRRGVGKSSPLLDIVDPKPIFLPGPRFPERTGQKIVS